MKSEFRTTHLFELCLILTLLFFCFAFYLSPRNSDTDDHKLRIFKEENPILILDIRSIQRKIKLAPAIPQIPIAEDMEDGEDDPKDADVQDEYRGILDETCILPDENQKNEIHEKVEICPEIIHKEAIIYPPIAQKLDLEGTVYIRFVIDTKGNVESVEVIKGNKILIESAMQAIKNYKFRPAVQNGQFVRFRMILPVKFKLT